jgi:hypothetical protein
LRKACQRIGRGAAEAAFEMHPVSSSVDVWPRERANAEIRRIQRFLDLAAVPNDRLELKYLRIGAAAIWR